MSSRSLLLCAAGALCACLLCTSPLACSKSTTAGAEAGETPPPAPSFDGWAVKADVVIPPSKFYEPETRLEGKLKALRNTTYDVSGKRVQVNVIVPLDSHEADKIFRILANKKPAWAYVRKGDLLYEFVGQNDSMPDIQKAHDQLAAQ